MKLLYLFSFLVLFDASLGVSIWDFANPLLKFVAEGVFQILHNICSSSSNIKTTTISPGNESRQCGKRLYFGNGNRIVGGSISEEGEFPWIVSVRDKKRANPHVCGGSIVNERWIVTAAHCTRIIPIDNMQILAGKHNLSENEASQQLIDVSAFELHGFNSSNFLNDIALLQLSKPLVFNDRVQPICLPDPGETFTGSVIVSGWGRLNESGSVPYDLNKVTLPTEDNDQCKYFYTNLEYKNFITDCHICTNTEHGIKDACQGDSGGPVMCVVNNSTYKLCGIVSWGIGCARDNYPGVNTKVSCFSDWIKSVISK